MIPQVLDLLAVAVDRARGDLAGAEHEA